MRELIYRDEAIKAVYDKDIGMLTQWDIGRNAGIDYAIKQLEKLPSAQPELIEKAAYIRGFEQGRTQGMIDSQGGRNE